MPELGDFEGDWRLARLIDDRLAGQEGRFEGRARLTAAGDGALAYVESGTLHLGAAPPLQAERRYIWRAQDGRIAVFFADGRTFHSFRPTGEGAGTDHPCGADFYRVAYDFNDFPRWTTRWRVSGPRKDYEMRTTYLRA
ncbi:hypothetical protein EU805_06145 [Salipiger sp. IMCC34102]|uniref:DUF6314 family protein n=1 Tax=Salipiger sp. IMCC34102 TaxID=2510647 RepID=UPI00101CC146|nr:DUF6314 family protein [Salipiger sp. IMCC34102]RYH03300.1 hypothetical protein EU805_06145 [Salipiger sp. IMCC34102]